MTASPDSRLPDVLGHAGDGTMQPTIVFDPADPEQRRRAAVEDLVAVGGLTTAGRS